MIPREAEYEIFRYPALTGSSDQIRLLRFDPVDSGDRTRLILEPFALADAPNFNAISYTWGKPEDERQVLINGGLGSIRANCHYALSQARAQLPDEYYWIDSICIDQGNSDEKTKQVQLMWNIFSSAARVFACVGEHEHGSEELLHWTRELDVLLQTDGGSPRHVWYSWLSSLGELPAARLCVVFKWFANRPYWNRLWIVQEVAAANILWILCGKDFFSYRALDLLADILGEPMRRVAEQKGWIDIKPAVSTSLETVVLFTETAPLYIGLIFTNFGRFECEDSRDRLYGLLNLVKWPEGVTAPVPDYNKTAFQLALDLSFLIPLHRLDDMLVAFKIDSRHPEMEKLMRERLREDGAQSISKLRRPIPLYDPDFDSSNNYQELRATSCVRLQTARSGRLTAPFQRTSLSHGFISGLDDPFARCPTEPASSSDARSSPSVASTGHKVSQRVFCGSETVALICSSARSGDLLVHAGSRIRGCLLVLRHTTGDRYDVVGQGIAAEKHILPSRKAGQVLFGQATEMGVEDDHFEANVILTCSSEDVLLLVGQDLVGVKQDRRARLCRLVNNPVLVASGTARIVRETDGNLLANAAVATH